MSNEMMELQPDETQAASLSVENLLLNTKQIGQIYKMAKMYSTSDFVPTNYQGNPANCFVALEIAARMDVSPTLIMQNLFIVQGKPSWSGQFCVALINGCGLFDNLEFVFIGEPGEPSHGCYAQAVRRATGQMIRGTTITMQMAADEGWLNKSGSKWKTMPEQMLKYRAAAFFARTECPNILMGYQLADEVRDVRGTEKENQTQVIRLEDDVNV